MSQFKALSPSEARFPNTVAFLRSRQPLHFPCATAFLGAIDLGATPFWAESAALRAGELAYTDTSAFRHHRQLLSLWSEKRHQPVRGFLTASRPLTSSNAFESALQSKRPDLVVTP
jgi:hypothetical protein